MSEFIGRLRHRVNLEQRSQVADASVGITTTYNLVAQAYAEVQAVRGSIYAAGVQVGEGPTHRITIRYRDPTTFDHVSQGAQRWRVRDARDPDGRRRILSIMAEEMTPE